MLIKLLSDSDKNHLIELAELLALADKPLLWNGKRREEIAADEIDFNTLSIQEGEPERELIAELKQSVDSHSFCYFSEDSRLIKELKTFHRLKVESPETRVQAATTVLKEMLKGKKFELPSPPKVILFELLLVALRDGHISSIEWALLKEFQWHHQLEDFIFDELLERAETLNQEVSKTISIILE